MPRPGIHAFQNHRLRIFTGSKCYVPAFRCRQQSSSAKAPGPAGRRAVTREEFDRMNKFANKIIDGATKNSTPGWHHTKYLRGEEKRLASSIKSGEQPPRAMSLDKARYFAGEDLFEDDVDASSSVVFQPGTFVETRRNEVSTHGVVIGEEYWDRRWRVVVLASGGDIWVPIREDVMFAVAGLAPGDLAARCGKSEIATKRTELMARVELLKRLRQIEKSAEDAYGIVARTSHQIYSLVKSSDPDAWTTVTVDDVARIISPKPTLINTFAVHKLLMKRSAEFIADNNYRITHTFHVRPRSHLDKIEAVTAMSRLRDGPLDSFAAKGRSVIASNKRIFSESRAEAPTERPAEHVWTEDDKIILTFLLHSLRPHRSSQNDPYALGTAAILKRLDPHLLAVDDSVVHQALIDLGVLAPWQDLVTLRTDLGLDQEPEETSSAVMKQNTLVSKPPRTLTSPLGPEDFYSSDPLASVRHDFGDMPVYVIDDPGAQELDDGISIETIPSEPNTYWVHVHIADPASILPPTHVFSQQARKIGETAYYLHRTWPMLPRSLMRLGMSLGSSLEAGKPERVITFSGKINSQGELIDYQVRAGHIKNIHILNYDTIDLAMGRSLPRRHYPFGDESLPRKPPSTVGITNDQLNELETLNVVARRLVSWRMRQQVFNHSEMSAEIELFPQPSNTVPTMNPTSFRGFPNLVYSVGSSEEADTGSRMLVAEMMKIGCRITSRFCLDRGVPVLRRGAGRIWTETQSDLEILLSLRDSNGYVPFSEAIKYEMVVPAAEYSLEPKSHWSLGLPEGEGYSRATSPLRRYLDLVTHWQIHHALLGSAATSNAPPFSSEWLAEYGRQLVHEERVRKRAMETHKKFWKLLYLQRWLADSEKGIDRPNPLANLTAQVLSHPKLNIFTRWHQCEVSVPELGLRGLLGGLDPADIPLGAMLAVKIESIRLGTKPALTLARR